MKKCHTKIKINNETTRIKCNKRHWLERFQHTIIWCLTTTPVGNCMHHVTRVKPAGNASRIFAVIIVNHMVSGERGLRANWRGQVGKTRIDCKASTLENTRVLRDTACNTLDGYNARQSKLGLRRAQAPNENTRHRRRSWQRANNGGAKNDCLTCPLFNPFYFTTVFSDRTEISDLCLKFNFCAKLRTNVNGNFDWGYCEIEFLKKNFN